MRRHDMENEYVPGTPGSAPVNSDAWSVRLGRTACTAAPFRI